MHIWSVNADGARCAHCYLSGQLIEGDSFQRFVIVIVDGLEESVVVGEDGDGIATYVRLEVRSAVSPIVQAQARGYDHVD